MGSESTGRRRSTESSLVFTLLGVVVWITTGFLVGLVAGVVSEEPELVIKHATGQSTEIEWDGLAAPPPATQSLSKSAIGRTRGTPSEDSRAARDSNASALAGLAATRRPDVSAAPAATSGQRAKSADIGGVPVRSGATVAKTSNGPGFSIQVGAFAERDAAQEVAESLRGKGYSVRILSAQDDGRYRVRVGPVAARERAEGLARRLKSDEGLPTWVLRESEG